MKGGLQFSARSLVGNEIRETHKLTADGRGERQIAQVGMAGGSC
jgi:hypothetical protein